MIYYVDIDDTICISPKNDDGTSNYPNAVPMLDRIEKINKLYQSGHEVHYWTARGMNTGKDWKLLTYQQLTDWGCQYSSLKMKKPIYDKWIDDKAINDKDFFA